MGFPSFCVGPKTSHLPRSLQGSLPWPRERYLGELAEVKFRKIDLLKLMAEREGGVERQGWERVG